MHKLLFFVSFFIFISSCNISGEKKPAKKPLLFLPDDLEATLWAESPMFYNPTNMDVDAKGRIWITEAVNYRNFNNDTSKFLYHPKGDRVMILEDTNRDGKADLSKVFVQDKDLLSPLGIAVTGNKVYVSCSPNLIVYTDNDGDDKPDSKEILLTGFGGKNHDHSLHSVAGGPDGNLYFNTGNEGPHIVTDKNGWTLRSSSIVNDSSAKMGPQKSDDGKLWVGGLGLQMRPDGTGLQVLAHNFRNAYELAVDSRGDMWQNDNDDQVVACRTTWVMEGGNAGYFSTDGTRWWQGDQRPGQDAFAAHWHQDDPGVMPAGDKTGAGSPTGIVVNESDALGDKYMGMLLSADAGRNVIFGYHPRKHGSGYLLGERSNLITSLENDNEEYVWNDTAQNARKDQWFRPSDICIGTDGAIYIADWYDPIVGGHQMRDSVGYGRIYRISRKGEKINPPQIDLATMAGQVEALKNPAINVRFTAFEKLREQGESSIEPVKRLLNDKNPYHRARAIWLLSKLGGNGIAVVKSLLQDEDENMRVVAYRALRQVEDNILPLAFKLAKDPSSFVRREVIVSLQNIPFHEAKPVLIDLIKGFDGEDRWYLESLGAALEGHEEQIYTDLIKIFHTASVPPGQWDKRFASLIWRLHPSTAANDLKRRAGSSNLTEAERSKALTALAFINTAQAANAMVDLSRSELKDVAEGARYWLSFRQSNDWFSLLDWSKTGIDAAYEKKLSSMKIFKGKILDEHLPMAEKKEAVRQMAKDSMGGQLLLGMVMEKTLPKELYPDVEEVIFSNPDQSVRTQASTYFKDAVADKALSVPAIAKLPYNAGAGEKLFDTKCATCHRVGEKGTDIGPDLTMIRKKFDRESFLDAVVNPSAGIVFGYEPWTVNTKDGGSFFGFLIAESDKTVVIRDLSGKKITIASDNISSRKKQVQSLMPDPSVLGLNEQELSHIAGYLLTLKEK